MSNNNTTATTAVADKKIKIHGIDELLTIKEASKLLGIEDSVPAPYSFQFNDSKNHLYFLSNVKDSKNIKNIHYIDINTDEKETKPLFNYVDTKVELSLEDQLQRERQRISANGITQYTFDQKHQSFIAGVNNCLNTISIEESILKPVLKQVNGEIYNHQLSSDGRLISFIKEKDIWITDIETNEMHQITFSNQGDGNKFKYAGDVGFIYAEEFSRYTGYWWSPVVTTCEKSGLLKYTILFLEEDETDVMNYHIPNSDLKGETTQYKYPLVGEKNSTIKVCIVEFTLGTPGSGVQISIERKELYDLKNQFPWVEYFTRAGWCPDGNNVWVQILDRKQQHLSLVLIPLCEFNKIEQTTPLPVLIDEHSPIWVNIEFSFHFFKSTENQLIWSNEQTGYRHLYLINWSTTPSSSGDGNYKIENIKSRSITLDSDNQSNNQWMVSSDDIFVDESRQLVYFTGTKDSILENHLYVTSFANNSPYEIKRLTHGSYYHKSIIVSNDFSKFISTYSNLSNIVPKTEIIKLSYDGNTGGYPTTGSLFFISNGGNVNGNEASKKLNGLTIFNFKNSKGVTIYGQYSVPSDYSKEKKYPVVLYTYGGPHVNLVSQSVKVKQHYPNFGFIQVSIDNVGSANRGLEFEGYIKNKMGQVEVSDQVEGIEYLIKNNIVSIDRSRIAVTGWSYGGYQSIMCLAQRPDFFKIAISGAPVTKWQDYDCGYTERYMDILQDNKVGYELGDCMHYIKSIPNDEDRLVLIAGILDENVHWSNTVNFIHHLTINQKPYILKILANERHGIRNTDNRIYIDIFCINHLLKNL